MHLDPVSAVGILYMYVAAESNAHWTTKKLALSQQVCEAEKKDTEVLTSNSECFEKKNVLSEAKAMLPTTIIFYVLGCS